MTTQDPRYTKFLTALIHVAKTDWYRKIGLLAQESNISQGHLSNILNSKKEAPFDKQVAIANACGYDYDEFLLLGNNLIKEGNPTTARRSSKQEDLEISKEESVSMDEDVKEVFQDYIETLKLNEEKLRADFEREREAHRAAMASLREEYQEVKSECKELKLECRELRRENKQLLDQCRVLQKKAQPEQGQDKSKKAANH